ncbi:hypothetical protein ACWGKQ_18880 [Streptomyces sp. NPDC054770]
MPATARRQRRHCLADLGRRNRRQLGGLPPGPALAAHASHRTDAASEHSTADDLRRLTDPGEWDIEAAPLLRHSDLLENIVGLHRPRLMELLNAGCAGLP